MSALDDFDGLLNGKTRELLGDAVRYTPAGGAPINIQGFAAMGEKQESFGRSSATIGDRQVELSVADVPVRPDAQCTIRLVKLGMDFVPLAAVLNDTGDHWICQLKKKPA